MSVIRAHVEDQVLRIIEAPTIASGGQNEVKVAFTFCEKWDGFAKTATFYMDEENPYYAVLDSNDICMVPWEVYTEAGTFYIGVFGDKDGVTRTSTRVKYKVKSGAVASGMTPSDPSPDVYNQIMSEVAAVRSEQENFIAEVEDAVTATVETANKAAANANRVAQELTEARENGEFNGEDGRAIHFLRFNDASATGQTTIGNMVPQTGGRPFNVGDLGININGYLYEYIGDNEWGEHKIQFLAKLVKDGENGADIENGADGKSIFCSTEEKKATESADFHMQFIQTGDRELTVGDLILSSSGWLYRVTSISGTIATASFISILKGEKGDSASVEDVLAAIPTVTNITVTENADGSVTMVNTLSDGSIETIAISADEEGNPNGLTVNGVAIPLTWTEVTA